MYRICSPVCEHYVLNLKVTYCYSEAAYVLVMNPHSCDDGGSSPFGPITKRKVTLTANDFQGAGFNVIHVLTISGSTITVIVLVCPGGVKL